MNMVAVNLVDLCHFQRKGKLDVSGGWITPLFVGGLMTGRCSVCVNKVCLVLATSDGLFDGSVRLPCALTQAM